MGTSGWIYRHWSGLFYPAPLRGESELDIYSRHYDTVELNYSFYRLPGREEFESWRRRSPNDFLFAVKASRYLTHMKKLKEPAEPLQRLMNAATGLGPKLGPILLQFPASWGLNLPRLEEFTEALEPYRGQRFAMEFRHNSWLIPEVYRLLERARVCLCLPFAPNMPVDMRLTTDWTYARFHYGRHGNFIDESDLRAWADRIRGFADEGADAYVYFNNDTFGDALRDSVTFAHMVGVKLPREPRLAIAG